MPIRPSTRACAIAATVAGALSLAACATTPGGEAPTSSSAFSAEDFGWSTRAGQASIEGRIQYVQDGQTYACAGNVGLIPDTGYTRARMERLYGSTTRASVPAAVVRTRSAGEQGADYRAFERADACTDNSFRFSGLPDGSWFLISPVRADENIVVLMRRVQTRGGRMINVTLGN